MRAGAGTIFCNRSWLMIADLGSGSINPVGLGPHRTGLPGPVWLQPDVRADGWWKLGTQTTPDGAWTVGSLGVVIPLSGICANTGFT